MKPTLRKPAGVLGLIAGLALYAVLVASLAEAIGKLPILAQSLIYLVLGVVWVLPLRPLLLWMETGRWKAPR
jgi:hypothetical protein